MTIDGVGEWATASIAVGDGNQLRLLQQIDFPNSLGLLYATMTAYCGFRVNGGEGKLMGLAPYGKPRYADLIREKLIRVFPDGSFALQPDYFAFGISNRMHTRQLEQLLGFPPREPESEIESCYEDLAASIQCVTGERVVDIARHARELTGCSQLCLAGRCGLELRRQQRAVGTEDF